MISRDIGILGYGETLHVKRTERTLFSFLAEAGRKALESAGLRNTDIDGIAVSSFFLAPDNAVTLCEQFGLSVSWAWQFTAGSAGPVAGVIDALHAIDAGRANVVLCLGGRRLQRRPSLPTDGELQSLAVQLRGAARVRRPQRALRDHPAQVHGEVRTRPRAARPDRGGAARGARCATRMRCSVRRLLSTNT